MLNEEDEDGDVEVRFLRKAHKTDNAYVDPRVGFLQPLHILTYLGP